MSFFILGLPRSRTAWLANFMNYGGYHCYHEGSNGCHSMEEYKAKIHGSRVGDANTGIAAYNFMQHFSVERTVIIDSSIDEAVKYGHLTYDFDFTVQFKHMKGILDRVPGLHVDIKDINDKLETIWDYLTDNVAYNRERAEVLKGFNIQVNEPYEVDLVALRSFIDDQITL